MSDGKSTTSYSYELNERGAALNWDGKKKATVAGPSSQAECKDIAAAVHKAPFWKQLPGDFGIKQKHSMDNQICIWLC